MNQKTNYYTSVHRFGRISTLIAIALMFMVPLGTTLYYNVKLDWERVFSAAMQLCIVFIPAQLTEVISFSPILGAGGTYLSFITGNVMNMKLPAATSSHRLLDVEPHSEEGEVASVLAIGMSSITTTVIIFVGMFLLSPMIHYLENPILKPAFSSVMPAILGTMFLPQLRKNPKMAIVPLIIATIAGILIPTSQYGMMQGYLLIITMIASVLTAILTTNPNENKLLK